MAFLWGFLMYFICHTIANILANHAFFLFISIKCNWKNNVAQKRYIVIILFCVFAYALILAIALLVEPFSSYKGAILIGNGIGFITGSIHFMMMSDRNCKKQEEKYCINEDEEKVCVEPPIRETKATQSCPRSVNTIEANDNRDDDNVFMTNKRCWRIFYKILEENGNPFIVRKVDDNSLLLNKNGYEKTVKITINCSMGWVVVYDVARRNRKQYDFEESEEGFAECIKQVIVRADEIIIKYNVIRRGDLFDARTNYEFLNMLLGLNLRGYMKCVYPLTDTSALLMHTFDSINSGWINREMADGTVVEDFVGQEKIWDSHKSLPDSRTRILFKKCKEQGLFIFRGVYILSPESTPDRRVWKLIAEETNLHDY